jgi:hypothetical protein
VVYRVGRRLRHAPGTTRRAELSPLAEAHRLRDRRAICALIGLIGVVSAAAVAL